MQLDRIFNKWQRHIGICYENGIFMTYLAIIMILREIKANFILFRFDCSQGYWFIVQQFKDVTKPNAWPIWRLSICTQGKYFPIFLYLRQKIRNFSTNKLSRIMPGLYFHQNLLRGTIEASTQVGAILLTLPSLQKSIFIALLDALKSLQHYNDILTIKCYFWSLTRE